MADGAGSYTIVVEQAEGVIAKLARWGLRVVKAGSLTSRAVAREDPVFFDVQRARHRVVLGTRDGGHSLRSRAR